MSFDPETTRIVRSWLHEGVTELPDRVLDAVLDQVPATAQRRAAWWPVWRLPEMSATSKVALGVAAAVLFIVVGFTVVNGGGVGVPLPGDPQDPPRASPRPLPTSGASAEALERGRYALRDGFPVQVTADLGDGWYDCGHDGGVEQRLCRFSALGDGGHIELGFLSVDNVVDDPCTITALKDPPVGSSIDDLVAAISNLRGLEATAPEAVRVAGYPAKRFTVTAGRVDDCGATWATSQRVNGVGSHEINDLHVIDVDGTRIMIASAYRAGVDPTHLAAVEDLISSLEIDP